MTDYYPVLARAVSRLPANTAQARLELYGRARTIVIDELHRKDSQKSASVIVREQAAFEMAVRRVEAESFSGRGQTNNRRPLAPPPKNRATVADPVAQTKATASSLAKILHELQPDAPAPAPSHDSGFGDHRTSNTAEEFGGMLNSLGVMLLGITYLAGVMSFVGVVYIRGLMWVAAGVIAYPVLLIVIAVILCLFIVPPWAIFRKTPPALIIGILLRHIHSAPRRAS
jgi:hypothetical protein